MARLDPQPWMTAEPTRRLLAALEAERPGCARFVGGCVRNALLGEPVSDIDIATQLTPERASDVLGAAGFAVHPTGIEHGTITVVVDHHPFEITTLRRDVETDGRRAVVAYTEDWAEDAARRDFRVNALYAAPDGELFDLVGGGLDDLAARRIAFVGDPETRIREDYLRILRFFRFYAWYGRGEPNEEALAACGKLREGLGRISVERIWMETKKLLKAPDPSPSLDAMIACGVFGEVFHERDTQGALPALLAIERKIEAEADPLLRLTALFEGDPAAVFAFVLGHKVSNEERRRMLRASGGDPGLASDMTKREVRQAIYILGGQLFRDRVLLRWATGEGEAKGWMKLLDFADSWSPPELPVSGNDALQAGVKSGPDIGDAMEQVEAEWIASDFELSRDTLVARLEEIAGEGDQ